MGSASNHRPGRKSLSLVEAKVYPTWTHLNESDRRDLERVAVASGIRQGRGAVAAYLRLLIQSHLDECRGEPPTGRRGAGLCSGGDRRLKGSGVGRE